MQIERHGRIFGRAAGAVDPRDHGTAQHRSRGVVGMPLEFRGQLDQLRFGQRCRIHLCDKAVCRCQSAHHSGRRRAETTRVWDGVAATHHHPGCADICRLQPAFDGAHHQMLWTQRNLVGALPFDHHHQAGIRCLNDNFVGQTQCQADAVETRAEVGAGRRHHGACHQPGRQHLGHGQTLTTRAPTSRPRARDPRVVRTRSAYLSAPCRDP